MMLLSCLVFALAQAEVPSPPDTPGPNADPSGSKDSLPPLRPQERCDTYNGSPSAAATGYNRTLLSFSGNEVSGQEVRLLVANERWRAQGGADCKLVYTITGTKAVAPAVCPTCDYVLDLAATFDPQASTCRDQLAALFPHHDWPYEFRYHVTLEGPQTVVSTPNGFRVAHAVSVAGGLQLQDAHNCHWF